MEGEDGSSETGESMTEPMNGEHENGTSNGDLVDHGDEKDESNNQLTFKENIFYKSLQDGFTALKELRENKKKPLFDLHPVEGRLLGKLEGEGPSKGHSTCVTVNFIDPTTKGSPSLVKGDSVMSSQKKQHPAAGTNQIQDVYEKLTYIFQRDYGSTLRSVPYQRIRGGGTETIPSLPVRAVLTRSAGSDNGDVNVPWGGAAGTAAAPVSDPSEWHNGPYCHVYIAACDNMDHYRTKVKPSLQAFVSQIEAAATNAHPSSGSQGGNSAHYLIVYIPTGPKLSTVESEIAGATGRVGNALASRLRLAGQRIAKLNKESQEMSNDSVHSTDTFDSTDGASDMGDEVDIGAVALNLLTHPERNIYKRISSDFPNGKTCVFSISSLDMTVEETVETGIAAKTQEWSAFNRMLGTVIANGFKDRCRRYHEELKRLDAQRATPTKATAKSKGPVAPVSFNLSYFFLVKESLAFTFEQMQLPAEALLQYDEFRAFLPDIPSKQKKSRRKSKKNKEESLQPMIELADSGDYVGFRRRIRSVTDLAPIVDIVRRYLFARELCLLFKMEQPVELIARCQEFTKVFYAALLRGIETLSAEEQRKRKVEAAKWLINFSWDVKSSCEDYFMSLGRDAMNSDTMSVDTPGSDSNLSTYSESEQAEHLVARQLSELLETARLFLKQLGDTELEGENPIRRFEREIADDMLKSWEPWEGGPKETRSGRLSITMTPKEDGKDRALLLDDAFTCNDAYETKYLELTTAVVTYSHCAGRRRFASRLQGEIAEYYIANNELKYAAGIIKKIVKIPRWDQWDRCHFWRLFRLAYCQRTTARPTDYLKTLVTCFSPRLAKVAPREALYALQDDLQLVIGDKAVGESRYGKLAFIETALKIVETSSDESSVGTGPDRKKLLKRYCSVGEKVQIVLTVACHLPRPIELDSLKLFVVSFPVFSTIVENRESVEEEDAFRILSLDAPIKVNPGTNTFKFDWFPMSAGQYILSTVEIKWKEGFFYYDSMELGAPLLGVDVLPSDPTHSLALDPAYLVPGHDQQVRITFAAGSDKITAGTLQLVCSGGAKLIPPEKDPGSGDWQTHCEVELSGCNPGEQVVLVTHVRCGVHEKSANGPVLETVPSADTSRGGMNAKAVTNYLQAVVDGHDESKIPHMKTVLEAFAPILEKTVLTVDSVDAVWYPPGNRAMVCINLMCNTPHTYSLKGWKMYLPPPLKVLDRDEFNGHLINCSLAGGEMLSLAFECVIGEGDEATSSSDEPILNVKLQDQVGKTLSLDLTLDLEGLYRKKKGDDTGSSSVPVELVLSSSEGLVGEPVNMVFSINTSALAKLKKPRSPDDRLVYSLNCKDPSWILGGKVDGVIPCSDELVTCSVVGIPSFPGYVETFPTITLGYEYAGEDELVPLLVKFRRPPPFRSRTSVNHVAVASAASK